MNVLIADDDPVTRRLLQTYLTKWGHEVVAATNGAEAWRLFEEGTFPLVVSDWMMPEVDGVELIRRLRARPRSGYVYAILLTAKTQKEDLVQGMEAGADDFLTKPFDRDELRARVRVAERLLQLQYTLAERERTSRDGAAPAGGDPFAESHRHLTALGRDVRAAVRLLQKYQEAQALLACGEARRAAEALRTGPETDLPSLLADLPRRVDQVLAALRPGGAAEDKAGS